MSDKGFTTGLTGRADVARALAVGDQELAEYLAGILGYQFVPPAPPQVRPEPTVVESSRTPVQPSPTPLIPAEKTPFWRAQSYKLLDASKPRETGPPGGKPAPPARPVDLSFMPLSSIASLLTRLRAASPSQQVSGEIDVDRIVHEWCEGRFLQVLPRRSQKVWGRSVQLIVDRSRRLIPYWEDQNRAYRAIRDIYPPEGFSTVVLVEGESEPSVMTIAGGTIDYAPPPAGSTVVVLGDLGILAKDGGALVDRWVERGKRLGDLGVKTLAVVPLCRAGCPKELDRHWTILPWETGREADAPAMGEEECKAVVDQILTLLSFTLRIEPQLIRFVRRLLTASRGDPGIESRVWQHESLGDPHSEAAELPRDQAEEFRRGLARQDQALRSEIYARVEAMRRRRYDGIWYAELGNLGGETMIEQAKREEASNWIRSLARSEEVDKTPGLAAWFREYSERALSEAWRDKEIGPVLHEVWAMSHRDDPNAVPPAAANPAGIVDPRAGEDDRRESLVEILQTAEGLVARPFGPERASKEAASPVALIRTRNGLVKIEPVDEFWLGGEPPPWADDWGWDSFGPWVTIRVRAVVQRMRWVPAGTFMMGSPDDDIESYPDEKPQHKVNVPHGFWMFDTPCTQALWEAVSGKNPSHFKGNDRPVELVSWNDCQEFVKQLKEKCQGLELSLPTEAQWEYACRAGTETPRYRENLSDIAWYAANSGNETHPVGQKAANVWGLYDTLGNVWEWCASTWTNNYSKESEASAARVIRGGSWDFDARDARAACRLSIEPADRDINVGCRFAEFRSRREPSSQAGKQDGAERARERGGGSGADGARDQVSGAGWIHLDSPEKNRLIFAAVAPRRIASDVEQIELDTMTLPEWASAIERDKYGLWAEFMIEGKSGGVRQRLRWIPPGRFVMGSPQDEPGRWRGEQLPHEVVIDEGFWMFATPCTQAVWEAVMGENPSYFKSPDRPVEQVSWNRCKEFVESLNDRVNQEIRDDSRKLILSFPSEAQWEYACRAGTATSTYAGPLVIQGQRNAPILDAIAWYGGNSGHEFDLEDGLDARSWKEKQYPFDKAGTRRIAKKRANPWGLHDMLGNVWEWCADAWGHGGTGEASAGRVIRGGSWRHDARYARAACRYNDEPANRNNDIGCRFAEFRRGRELSKESEVSQGRRVEGAKRTEPATRRTKRGGRKKRSD